MSGRCWKWCCGLLHASLVASLLRGRLSGPPAAGDPIDIGSNVPSSAWVRRSAQAADLFWCERRAAVQCASCGEQLKCNANVFDDYDEGSKRGCDTFWKHGQAIMDKALQTTSKLDPTTGILRKQQFMQQPAPSPTSKSVDLALSPLSRYQWQLIEDLSALGRYDCLQATCTNVQAFQVTDGGLALGQETEATRPASLDSSDPARGVWEPIGHTAVPPDDRMETRGLWTPLEPAPDVGASGTAAAGFSLWEMVDADLAEEQAEEADDSQREVHWDPPEPHQRHSSSGNNNPSPRPHENPHRNPLNESKGDDNNQGARRRRMLDRKYSDEYSGIQQDPMNTADNPRDVTGMLEACADEPSGADLSCVVAPNSSAWSSELWGTSVLNLGGTNVLRPPAESADARPDSVDSVGSDVDRLASASAGRSFTDSGSVDSLLAVSAYTGSDSGLSDSDAVELVADALRSQREQQLGSPYDVPWADLGSEAGPSSRYAVTSQAEARLSDASLSDEVISKWWCGACVDLSHV